MMRSSDEIKKGLDCCADGNIVCAGNCVFDDDIELVYPDCVKLLMTNALALIQQLEADKKQLEGMLTHMNQLRDAAAGRALKMEERARQFEKDNDQLRNYIRLLQAERDAAVEVLKSMGCDTCIHDDDFVSNECIDCTKWCNWEWRGVQKEATS